MDIGKKQNVVKGPYSMKSWFSLIKVEFPTNVTMEEEEGIHT